MANLDNKKPDSVWAKILEAAMDQSTSFFILVFGGVLVISSIANKTEEKYILVSLLTLFYALGNHYLSVFSKQEDIRPYARTGCRFWLFGVISWLLFILWVIIMTMFLLSKLDNVLDAFLNFLKNHYQLVTLLPLALLISTLALFVIWLICILCIKKQRQRGPNYTVQVFCKNCDFKGSVSIPKGIASNNYNCPACGVVALEKNMVGKRRKAKTSGT